MQTTLSSKGQITLPAEIRRQLRLKQGSKFDVVVSESGQIVMTPAAGAENPFLNLIGLGRLPDGMTAVEWVRSLRDDEE
ncbi:AbrB/MazE/SpoVT family DNA-binding domain-containing protein [Deinococcus sp.]|uniref:AbrB/MazE/SpoVT family DNA-binding domain-containing protein n=1 Tax=Deinococcus sp. TaxID=47478 RepID=UPI003B58F761